MSIFKKIKETISTHRRLFLIAVLTLIISLTATLTYFSQHKKQTLPSKATTDDFPQILSAQTDPTQQPPEELTELNILLLGFGGAGHQGGFLTDVIQILHLDFVNKKASLISVPRDLWVKLPNGKQAKINTAFTLGEDPNQPIASGGQVAKQMASAVTGLKIDYFIAIDFVGFKRLIGQTLDGLEVEVPQTLEDPWYPIKGEEQNPCGKTPEEIATLTTKYTGFELEKQFPCRYEHLYFPAGKNTMEGHQALAYVRSRHGSVGGDFDRSQRQHALLKALRDKLISLQALQNIPKFFQLLTQHVTTDLELKAAQYLAPAIATLQTATPQSLVLSTTNVFTSSRSSTGAFILTPKESWNKVHEFVSQNLN